MYGSPGSYTIATAAAGTAARTSSSARGQRRECTFDWTHTPAGAVLSAGRTQGMAAKQDRGRGVGRNASRRRVKAAGRYRVTGAQCIPKGGPNGRGPAAASTNIAVPHGRCQPLRRVAARDDECMSADWQPQAPGRPSAHPVCGPICPSRPPPPRAGSHLRYQGSRPRRATMKLTLSQRRSCQPLHTMPPVSPLFWL